MFSVLPTVQFAVAATIISAAAALFSCSPLFARKADTDVVGLKAKTKKTDTRPHVLECSMHPARIRIVLTSNAAVQVVTKLLFDGLGIGSKPMVRRTMLVRFEVLHWK